MAYPDFIKNFPSLELPFPDDVVQSSVIRSDAGAVVFFTFLKDFDLPPHAHKDQWGTVVAGQIELTVEGETKVHGPGSSYHIPGGAVHGARIKAGTCVIDVFEEPDRYPIRAGS